LFTDEVEARPTKSRRNYFVGLKFERGRPKEKTVFRDALKSKY